MVMMHESSFDPLQQEQLEGLSPSLKLCLVIFLIGGLPKKYEVSLRTFGKPLTMLG